MLQHDGKGDDAIYISALGCHKEILKSLVHLFLIKQQTAQEIAGIAAAIFMSADIVCQCAIAVGRDTGSAIVIDVGHFVGGIAHTLGCGSLDLACLMSLSVKFESLGLVQREELAYAVEVAQIAHGFAMALVGSLAVVFNSLGAIGFQATVAQLVVKTHLELAGSNIIVG